MSTATPSSRPWTEGARLTFSPKCNGHRKRRARAGLRSARKRAGTLPSWDVFFSNVTQWSKDAQTKLSGLPRPVAAFLAVESHRRDEALSGIAKAMRIEGWDSHIAPAEKSPDHGGALVGGRRGGRPQRAPQRALRIQHVGPILVAVPVGVRHRVPAHGEAASGPLLRGVRSTRRRRRFLESGLLRNQGRQAPLSSPALTSTKRARQ